MDKQSKGARKHLLHRTIIAACAVIGVIIMGYLSYLHYAKKQSFCDISETISCDIVTTSLYSEIFGIPVSVLGLGFFIFILVLVLTKKQQQTFQNIFFLSLLMLIPALYLSLMELTQIKAFCILCESSKVLILGILFTAFSACKTNAKTKITFQMTIPILIAGIVASSVMYFAQTGTMVRTDATALVACMNEANVTYYTSFKCQNCKRQQKLLGDAYKNLRQIECHPDGPNSHTELCFAKKVNKTPTFLIEENGEEQKRAEGLQSLENLARFSGCESTLDP